RVRSGGRPRRAAAFRRAGRRAPVYGAAIRRTPRGAALHRAAVHRATLGRARGAAVLGGSAARPGGAAFYPLIVGEAIQRPAVGTRAGAVPRGCSTDAAAAVAGGGIAAYGASAWAVVAACAPHPAVV